MPLPSEVHPFFPALTFAYLARCGNSVELFCAAHRFRLGFKLFFAPDFPRGQLRHLLNAPLDGTKNKTGRRPSDTCHRFPHVVRTTQFRSQSIACWPFLNRNSRPHLPNYLLPRLRSVLTWMLVYDFEANLGSHNYEDEFRGFIVSSRTPPWLPSEWGCRGRRLSGE